MNFLEWCLEEKILWAMKLLLFSNLKELYVAYKEIYPDRKIGLSNFCKLRPKLSVTVSLSVTHSVCIFTHHQTQI